MKQCNVCQSNLSHLLYHSESGRSLTSLATVYQGVTEVYICHCCGHIQSAEIENVSDFYDHDYDILVGSEEEDQLYEIREGRVVYRTEHQIATLRHKLRLPRNAKILDYGCAKSSMMRALLEQDDLQVQPYLFDVSDRYIPFWEKFLSNEQWAIYTLPTSWMGQFDAVTSFFSLEHMTQPQQAIQNISSLLKLGGKIYGIVPHVFTNTADLIVVDHVNHFTHASLQYLLQSNGFKVIEIDSQAHRGALIFLAEKQKEIFHTNVPYQTIQNVIADAEKIADFWKQASKRLADYEQQIGQSVWAIYGAGFYGAFIYSRLQKNKQVVCVVDQNPFLQGKEMNGLPIVSPDQLPLEVDVLWVGLNPTTAKQTITSVPAFAARSLKIFFL